PCVLASDEGILVSVLTDEGPRILCLSSDCSSIVRMVRLSLAGAVRDMCWLPDSQLGVCCDGGLCAPAPTAGGLHPEKIEDTDASHSDSPSAAIASLVLLTLAASERPSLPAGWPTAASSWSSHREPFGHRPADCDRPADEAIRNLRPHRVRICKQRRVVIVDRANCSVLVCESDGSLSFRVGPNFANDGSDFE
uniref:ANAPC4_WD40 domain-containing protein n=1 Tax=Macrostomum lignano TaxID=282301 RepID=A0A1I8FSA1_9PLAT